jgi:hypothetical protein
MEFYILNKNTFFESLHCVLKNDLLLKYKQVFLWVLKLFYSLLKKKDIFYIIFLYKHVND